MRSHRTQWNDVRSVRPPLFFFAVNGSRPVPASPPNALDVRPLSPPRKSATVLATFDRLNAGESFILVDDVNPARLRTHIEEERPGQGQWIYLQKGPHVWCVRVARQRKHERP